MSLIYEEVGYKKYTSNVRRFVRMKKILDMVTNMQPNEYVKACLLDVKKFTIFIKNYERTITRLVGNTEVRDLLRETALYALNFERHMKYMRLLQEYIFIAKRTPVLLRTNTDYTDVSHVLEYFASDTFLKMSNSNKQQHILTTAYFILIDSDGSSWLDFNFMKTKFWALQLNRAIQNNKSPAEIEQNRTPLEESIEQLFQVSLESVNNQEEKEGLEDYTVDEVVKSFSEHVAYYDLQSKLYKYKIEFYSWVLKNCTVDMRRYEAILAVLNPFLLYREDRRHDFKKELVIHVRALLGKFRADVLREREVTSDESLYAKFMENATKDFVR